MPQNRFVPLRHFAHQYYVLFLRWRKWRSVELDASTEEALTSPSASPRIFVLLAADYGNLGDIAIRAAQVDLLMQLFPDHVIVDVSQDQTLAFIRRARKALNAMDSITMVGGGAMGDLYHDAEYLHRATARAFRRQRILVFPCSPLFQDTFFGRWWLRLSRRAYARHGDITILVRDRSSLARATEYFPGTRLVMAPDVVLTMRDLPAPTGREGVVLALRSDVEAALTPAARVEVMRSVSGGVTARESDTDINNAAVSEAHGRELLSNLLGVFGSAEVVVTDRLHGAIFAILMGTPCVVFDNSYGKIHEFLATWRLEGEGVRVLKTSQAGDVPHIVAELRRENPPTPDPTNVGNLLVAELHAYFSEGAARP